MGYGENGHGAGRSWTELGFTRIKLGSITMEDGLDLNGMTPYQIDRLRARMRRKELDDADPERKKRRSATRTALNKAPYTGRGGSGFKKL